MSLHAAMQSDRLSSLHTCRATTQDRARGTFWMTPRELLPPLMTPIRSSTCCFPSSPFGLTCRTSSTPTFSFVAAFNASTKVAAAAATLRVRCVAATQTSIRFGCSRGDLWYILGRSTCPAVCRLEVRLSGDVAEENEPLIARRSFSCQMDICPCERTHPSCQRLSGHGRLPS